VERHQLPFQHQVVDSILQEVESHVQEQRDAWAYQLVLSMLSLPQLLDLARSQALHLAEDCLPLHEGIHCHCC
jgi:hypothetical protein